MASASEVVVHHNLLSNSLSEVLSVENLAIVEAGEYTNWQNVSWPRKVFFELKSGKWHTKTVSLDDQDPLVVREFVPEFSQPRADRDKGGAASLFEVRTLGNGMSLWACWGEEWRSVGSGQFGLVGGGWSFFFNVENGPFTQLFRAEWDQLKLVDGSDGRGGRAGQPHWHVDLRSEVIHESSIGFDVNRPAVDTSLVEIATGEPLRSLEGLKATKSYSLYRSGVHLAMAAKAHEPGCEVWSWQVQVDDDFAKLRSWAMATLEYVKEESTHLSLR